MFFKKETGSVSFGYAPHTEMCMCMYSIAFFKPLPCANFALCLEIWRHMRWSLPLLDEDLQPETSHPDQVFHVLCHRAF